MILRKLWVVYLLWFANTALAQLWGGSGFEGKISSFTDNLISVILPAAAILGLLYAAMLAIIGDEGAKKRMVLVIAACVIGFLAPLIIRWFQSAAVG